MRFRSFQRGGLPGIAIAHNNRLVGMTSDQPGYPGQLQTLVATGPEAIASAYDVLMGGSEIERSEISYLPVLGEPRKILCVGLNYRDHSAESGFKQPDYPTLFARFASSLVGHEEPLIRPSISEALDFEGELAVVVGRRGRGISEADALDFVAGYAVFNDASVRDYQHMTSQWTIGKNFDGTGAFGPEFVTASELPAGGSGLKIETRLNGAVVQSSNTADMVFDVKTLIAVISQAITIEAGDVIACGTPAGVGHSRTPRLYMRHGDICEVEIEGLGVLRNIVMDENSPLAAKAAENRRVQ
jgi:acylpyruvate hydrolase